jgi:N-methylhydantoinase A/oxoprolinase/acetone carboxylase beta subunit
VSLSLGIDVGGTFTDLAAIDADGRVVTRKVLSTPADQSVGVENALRALGADPDDIARLVHGTTVVTNLLLERTGARVVLCATEGATDLLELRRQERASLYDLAVDHPAPLVPPAQVVAVPERVEPQGITRALTDSHANEIAERVAAMSPDIVAVSLLHSYAFPAHERRLAHAIASRLPGVDVVCSSEVLPEIREYERTTTTAAEAYARPRVAGYLARLASRLAASGSPAPDVMTSGGGVRTTDEAAQSAASLALSGPAGGIAGAAAVMQAAGFPDGLTIDIGGTSADVGLIEGGEPLVESGGTVAGVPIALPRVLVETVSAGGGSVAWVDEGGALRVGPRSAGARPGPAAFGLGGTEPTLTDAHVVLGRISSEGWSGGLSIDVDAARRAIEGLARRLGVDATRAAEAIVSTADATMARALRRVSVERGVDPRSGVLVAFGGGGPLHACGLAERLGITRVLVPPYAGVLSALGLALAPARREAIASVMRLAQDLDLMALARLSGELAQHAGGEGDRRYWARARYVGQGHELEVPMERGDDGEAVAHRFTVAHRARVGFSLSRPVEIVSARVSTSTPTRPPDFTRAAREIANERVDLDAVVRGPAVVTLPDATLLVADGWRARRLPVGGWLLETSPLAAGLGADLAGGRAR